MLALQENKNSPKPAVMDKFVALVIKDDAGLTLIRSMRITDKLQDIVDFYYAMVPAVPRGTGVFLYQGKRVAGKQTPVDGNMKNGDRIEFFTEMKPDMFVTVTVRDGEERRVTCTMRKSDKMAVLMDLYDDMMYRTLDRRIWAYGGRRVESWETPADCKMMDGDQVELCFEFSTRMLLRVTVVDAKRRRATRTMRSDDKMQVLMDFYYATVPIVTYGSGKFVFEGVVVESFDTPMILGMEDDDKID